MFARPRSKRLGFRLREGFRLARTVRRAGLHTNLNAHLLPFVLRALREWSLGPHLIYPFQAANVPDRVAVIHRDRRLTYRQLNQRINRAASGLLAIGVRPGDTLGVMLHNCSEFVEVSAALQKLGVGTVPISTQFKAKEAGYILADSDAVGVILAADKREIIEAAIADNPRIGKVRCVVVGGPAADMVPYDELQAHGSPEEVAVNQRRFESSLLMYTSGTTGRPKGAGRSLQAVGLEVALNYIDLHDLRVGDVHYAACPLYHAAPSAFAMLTMLLNGTLVIADKFDAEQTLRDIETHRVTTTQLVPTQIHRLVNIPEDRFSRHDLSSLRVMVSTAAYLAPAVKRRALERFGPVLYEMYGATEVGIVTVARPEELVRNPRTVGKAVPGVEVLLLGDEGNPVDVGRPGELYVRTPMRIEGYHKNPEATAQATREDYFSVGDVAKVDREGYYYILDRKSDMVISGGVNIYPAEIEEELSAHPAVFEAAVVGVPDEEWGESVKAFVVLKPGHEVTAEALIEWCGDRLARLKRPRWVEFVDELPRNPQGKVLKRQLRKTRQKAEGRSPKGSRRAG